MIMAPDAQSGKPAPPDTSLPNIFQINRAIRRKESGLSPMAKMVLQEIIDRADSGAGVCTWSTEEIAGFLGISDRHARKIVTDLAAGAYLEIIRRGESKFSYKAMRIGPKLVDLAMRFGKIEPRCTHATQVMGQNAP